MELLIENHLLAACFIAFIFGMATYEFIARAVSYHKNKRKGAYNGYRSRLHSRIND